MSTQAYRASSGWTMFAAVVMISVGFLRVISGISYLSDSHKVNDLTLGLFGDNLWAWGIWDLRSQHSRFTRATRCSVAAASGAWLRTSGGSS